MALFTPGEEFVEITKLFVEAKKALLAGTGQKRKHKK